MALQIMKLAISATSSVQTGPTPQRFFYVTSDEVEPGTVLTIDAEEFFDDSGGEVTELPELADNNSMYNVYINGVLQMDGLSTYVPGPTGTGLLSITVPVDAEPILVDTPIVLEVLNFVPTSEVEILT